MADLIVTIDGPAASGKSTVARRLAATLGAAFLDTGAMYRAVTLVAVRDGVDLTNGQQLVGVIAAHAFRFKATRQHMSAFVDGEDVTEDIRDPLLTARVRYVASSAPAREKLVDMQRAFAAEHDRVVTEGRDQGTVAFSDADVKFYLTAAPAERARRRAKDLADRGMDVDIEHIRRGIEDRDRSDRERAVGPLRPAEGAVVLDTTNMRIEDVVERVYRCVEERCPGNR